VEIIVGKTSGFCFGVSNAIEKTKQELKKLKNVYCLGELVHNSQVIDGLKEEGAYFINTIEEAKGNVIIRAHGIPEDIYEKAKTLGLTVNDFTCPKVRKIHEIVKDYSSKGYYILLIGKSEHPEIIGIVSCCEKNYSVIRNVEDVPEALSKLKDSKIKSAVLISQTTFNMKKFLQLEQLIKSNINPDITFETINTICNTSEMRQKETEDIAKKVDYMIIIGDKTSNNTKELFEIASKHCDNSVFISTKSDIDANNFKKYAKIGIMAGASTPKQSINEVVELLESNDYLIKVTG